MPFSLGVIFRKYQHAIHILGAYIDLESIHNELSSFKICKSGVPQGSILGPLFYIVYVNDIINALSCSSIHLYADDTVLTFADRDLEKCIRTFDEEIPNIVLWFNVNKLTLNERKTKAVIFGKKCKLAPISNHNIHVRLKINNYVIHPEKEIRYLGVVLDASLTFQPHIEYISKKISQTMGVLSHTPYTK